VRVLFQAGLIFFLCLGFERFASEASALLSLFVLFLFRDLPVYTELAELVGTKRPEDGLV